MTDIAFFGDPHGDYRALARLGADIPSHALFLGDYDLERPFDEELSGLVEGGSRIHWIHGNHDTDREEWHDNLFKSGLADKSINGIVAEVEGFQVAGLGGVFRGKVWNPNDGTGEPRFRTRDEYYHATPTGRWRNGIARTHRSTIFPEDFDRLVGKEADILLTHEAPSSHKHGFKEIDELAEMMGARLIVHGHHHVRYLDRLDSGVTVIGLDKAGLWRVRAEHLRRWLADGDLDAIGNSLGIG